MFYSGKCIQNVHRCLAAAHCPVDLALGVAIGFGLALVVVFLAAGDADIDFRLAVLEPDAQRHDRLALLLDLGFHLPQLGFVHQQLAGSIGIVIGVTAEGVGLDRCADKPEFAIAQAGVRFTDRRLAIAQALDLGPVQNDPGLDAVLDKIVVGRAAIAGNYPIRPSLFFFGRCLCHIKRL